MFHNGTVSINLFLKKALFLLLCTAVVFAVLTPPVEAKVPEDIRIGVIASVGRSAYPNAALVKFSVQGQYQVIDGGAFPGLDILGEIKEGDTWQVAYLTSGIQVIANGEPLTITGGPVIIREVEHSGNNLVNLRSYTANNSSSEVNINKRYRGNMEFKLATGHLVAANHLPLDEYLYGVVPREMSNSWPVEALKAQSLAARTYAVANYNRRISNGFNLLDTVDDQAYGGFNSEGDQATRAVQQTAGQIILYDGKPISAVYHSNAGKHTENNENVWNGPPLPYLRGKPDSYSVQRKFGTWKYETVATGTDAKGRPGIQDKLRELDPKFGTLAGFQLEKFSSGRVKNIVIHDTDGYTIERTGSEFGRLFNPSFYTYLNEESFMSNFFDITTDNYVTVLDGSGQQKSVKGGALSVITDNGLVSSVNSGQADFFATNGDSTSMVSNQPGNITIIGHGWGHGVGMSQWGAYQMAQEGKSYQEILTFYYTGVTISSSY